MSGAPAGAHAVPGPVWRELVSRIGTAVPASARDLPRLKRRLIRAGFRNPNAARYFQGIRPVDRGLVRRPGVIVRMAVAAHARQPVPRRGRGGPCRVPGAHAVPQLRVRRRQHAIARGLPNALDLMVVCVESGLGIDQTMLQVAKELQSAHPEICSEFTVMNLELRAGKRRADALHNLADRTGVEDVKKLVAVLVQTDRFGTSIAQSLRGHADYLRTMAGRGPRSGLPNWR